MTVTEVTLPAETTAVAAALPVPNVTAASAALTYPVPEAVTVTSTTSFPPPVTSALSTPKMALESVGDKCLGVSLI